MKWIIFKIVNNKQWFFYKILLGLLRQIILPCVNDIHEDVVKTKEKMKYLI